MNTGQRLLKAWFDRSHMAQKDFAAKIEVSDGYLSQLLSGDRTPGLATAQAIEAETGVPMGSWLETSRGKVEPAQKVSAK